MVASVYARKSTDQSSVADDQKSVARQVGRARSYAARKGWTVADEHVYIDDGISGAEFANRPGFLRLMNALKPRAPFRVLIMSEESRLGREAIETAYALKQLVTAGVREFFYLEDRERTLDSPTDQDPTLADGVRRRTRTREGAPAHVRCDAGKRSEAKSPVGVCSGTTTCRSSAQMVGARMFTAVSTTQRRL